MNKITKILSVLLFSSVFALNVNAGELTVTGTAKASYSLGGSDASSSKGIGISNEIGLGASGELDNGYTWNYAIALDPNAGGTIDNDDQSLTLTTPYGTVGAFVSAGGLSTELGFGVGANGVGTDFSSPMTVTFGEDLSNYENFQYHSPAGLLPFGVVVKAAYASNLTVQDSQDFKAGGGIETGALGNDATMYQITASPVAGLTVGVDYFETEGGTNKQTPTAGNAYAKYTMGPVTVGYHKGYADVAIAAAKNTVPTNYENTSYGIQFAVNDNLSLSYSIQKSDEKTRVAIANGAASNTKTSIEAEVKSLQAAYNIGGATVGVTRTEAENSDYDANKEENITLFTIAMAF